MIARPSARLQSALAAEAGQLARERARLVSRRDELTAELARIEDGVAEIDERQSLLQRLAAPFPAGVDEMAAGVAAAVPGASAGPPAPGAPAAGGRRPAGTGRGLATGTEHRPAPGSAADPGRESSPTPGVDGDPAPGTGARRGEAAGAEPRPSAGSGPGPGRGHGPASGGPGPAPGAPPSGSRRARRGLLRGTAVREEAARVLAGSPWASDGLHYVQWLGLLEEAGWAVDGKDPRAVFLTQVSRSPVVRRTTVPGVYALDRDAPDRIQRGLHGLQDELGRLAAKRGEGPEVRRRRRELTLAIGRAERALDECARVLGPLGKRPAPPRLAVAR